MEEGRVDLLRRELPLIAELAQRGGPAIIDKDQTRGTTGGPDKFEVELRAFLKGERRQLTVAPDEPINSYAQVRALAAQQRDLTKSPATAGVATPAMLISHSRCPLTSSYDAMRPPWPIQKARW